MIEREIIDVCCIHLLLIIDVRLNLWIVAAMFQILFWL